MTNETKREKIGFIIICFGVSSVDNDLIRKNV